MLDEISPSQPRCSITVTDFSLVNAGIPSVVEDDALEDLVQVECVTGFWVPFVSGPSRKIDLFLESYTVRIATSEIQMTFKSK